ncbi:unnamed protein product, partial [Prunus brigantina]
HPKPNPPWNYSTHSNHHHSNFFLNILNSYSPYSLLAERERERERWGAMRVGFKQGMGENKEVERVREAKKHIEDRR